MIDYTNKPILLKSDNFTPLVRTPWAGSEIGKLYKKDYEGKAIGESWEFSCDPAFPSGLQGGGTLQEFVEAHPEKSLSKPLMERLKYPTCEILIKLLNAASPLSLQVHPDDDDQGLGPDECGKPESWLVLHAEKGAGIYLGFSRVITVSELERKLTSGDNIEELLQFVPVKAGDYFDIAPGVPHAIGPGVVLLEPQRIRYGNSGKTYRLWDWGRKYNDRGEIDLENGRSRDLHLSAGLKLLDLETQVGPGFVDSTRRSPVTKNLGSCQWSAFPANSYYQVHLLDVVRERISFDYKKGYLALVVLGGEVRLEYEGGVTILSLGSSAFLPAALSKLEMSSVTGAKLTLVHPAGTNLKVVMS